MSSDSSLDTWFVLYTGQSEGETNEDPNALAYPADAEAEIRKEFSDTINNGYADKDRGLFLVKLTGVSDEDAEKLEDLESLRTIVLSDFDGFAVEKVEEYKTLLSDWAPEALGDLDELDAESKADDDGWHRY